MRLLKLVWIAILMLGSFRAYAGQTTYYIYDESGHVIGEYDANGNPVQEHIYLNDRPVAVAVTNGGTTGIDYVQTDQLNTPRVITDASKTVLWTWNSDPFGNGNPTGSLTYNLRFPGQYYDAETGHNYNYERDYDPSTGRYIESDPIGLKAGTNTYVYALGSPLLNDDRFGLCSHTNCIVTCTAALAMAFCIKTVTVTDDNGNETTTRTSDWYVWPKRPFSIIGAFHCNDFPGNLPASQGPFSVPGITPTTPSVPEI